MHSMPDASWHRHPLHQRLQIQDILRNSPRGARHAFDRTLAADGPVRHGVAQRLFRSLREPADATALVAACRAFRGPYERTALALHPFAERGWRAPWPPSALWNPSVERRLADMSAAEARLYLHARAKVAPLRGRLVAAIGRLWRTHHALVQLAESPEEQARAYRATYQATRPLERELRLLKEEMGLWEGGGLEDLMKDKAYTQQFKKSEASKAAR